MKKIIFILSCLIAITACNSSSKYSVTSDGLQYMYVVKSEKTDLPKVGDKLLLKIKYFSASDSLIFDSREISDDFIMDFVTPTDSVASVNHAYAMMHEGDSISFKLNAEYFFSTYQRGSMPSWLHKGDDLRFEIKLEKIYSAQEFEEEAQKIILKLSYEEEMLLQEYMLINYPECKSTKSGLFYIQEKAGSGKKVPADAEVVIHYKASYLNGDKIYSSYEYNKPLIFKLTSPDVWPGLAEGVSLMKKGEQATLILPSTIAAGKQGEDPIPPCKTIKLEVLLIDFK